MKSATLSSTKPFAQAAFLGCVIVLLALAGGCSSMADPDGTDLPWAERPPWEFAPSIPQSMLPQ